MYLIYSKRSKIKVDPLGKGHLSSKIDGTCRSSHILLPTIRTGFPSPARMLLATESATDLCTWWTNVHVDYPAIRSVRTHPPEGVADVLGEKTATETLGNTVIDGDGLFKGGIFLDEENGAEILLLQEGSALGSLDDSWLDEIPTSWKSFTTVQNFSPLFFDPRQSVVVYLHSSWIVERSAEGGRVKGVANFDRRVSLDQFIHKIIVMLLVDEQPPQRGASLPAGAHCCEGASLECQFQIGILVDYGSIISTQL